MSEHLERARLVLEENPVLHGKIAAALGVDQEGVQPAMTEALRFMELVADCDEVLTPPLRVDLAWHEYIKLFSATFRGQRSFAGFRFQWFWRLYVPLRQLTTPLLLCLPLWLAIQVFRQTIARYRIRQVLFLRGQALPDPVLVQARGFRRGHPRVQVAEASRSDVRES